IVIRTQLEESWSVLSLSRISSAARVESCMLAVLSDPLPYALAVPTIGTTSSTSEGGIMAAFEVFVPVQGEIIFTVEADNAVDAKDSVSTIDWSDGELNVDIDYADEIRVERISDEHCTFCGAVLVREDCPN